MFTHLKTLLLLVLVMQCTGCSSVRHTYNKFFGKEVSADNCSEIGCGLDGTCAAPGVMEGHGSCDCEHCNHHTAGYNQAIKKYRTQRHVGHRGKVADCPHMKYRRKLGQSLVKRPRGVSRSMKHTYGAEIYDLPYPELAGGELFPGDDGMMQDYCPICQVSYCPDCLGIEDDYYYQGGEDEMGYSYEGMMGGEIMHEGEIMDGQFMPDMQYQQNGMPANMYMPQPGEVYTPGQQSTPNIPDDGQWKTSPDSTSLPGSMNSFPQGEMIPPVEQQPQRMNPMTPGLPPASPTQGVTPPEGLDTIPHPLPAPTPNISGTTSWRTGANFPGYMPQNIPASYMSNQSNVTPPELLIK